jgi:hypothetical protein
MVSASWWGVTGPGAINNKASNAAWIFFGGEF